MKKIPKANADNVLSLTEKILRILYIVILVLGVYVLTLILKEWGIFAFLFKILKVISPLFIGFLIAWLLDPMVKKLTQKGMKRIIATVLVYLGFLITIYLVISLMIPSFSNEVNEFVKVVPDIVATIKNWINNLFDSVGSNANFDLASVKTHLFTSIENLATNITNDLPGTIVNAIGSLFSFVGVILIGIILGFYLLFDFNNVNHAIITFLPKKWRKEGVELTNEINTSLRGYVQGVLLDSTILFLVTSLAFWAIGIKAPLLFGLICGLTNLIPYVGPYIGGAPVALVGFVQSPLTGILVIVAMVIIQFLEGNILQPIIIGKSMKIHPVAIIMGLLIFGSLFGVVGMILSTPIIGILKQLITFLDRKFDIFKWIKL